MKLYLRQIGSARGTALRWMRSIALVAGLSAVVTASSATDLMACSGGFAAMGAGVEGAELDDGRAVLRFDQTLALLAADRQRLSPLAWPRELGRIGKPVGLPGRGVLVGASHGLLWVDSTGGVHVLDVCARTGSIALVERSAQGQVLLQAERGMFEFAPDGALRQLTSWPVEVFALPDGRWLAEVEGTLFGLNDSGAMVPLLTGALAAGDSLSSAWDIRGKQAADWIRWGRGWLTATNDGLLFVADDGRVARPRGPDGAFLHQPYVLGRHPGPWFSLWLRNGTYRLEPGGGWSRLASDIVLDDVDWQSISHSGSFGEFGIRDLPSLPGGHSLARTMRRLFLVTREGQVRLLYAADRHARVGEDWSVAALPDGGAYVAAFGEWFRLEPSGRFVTLPRPDAVSRITSVERFGASHVVVRTADPDRQYRLDDDGRPRRLPDGLPVADQADRLYLCERASGGLLSSIDGSRFEPVPAAAGRRCKHLARDRSGSVLVGFDDAGTQLRLDRQGAGMPLPWRSIKLSDGELYLDREPRAVFVRRSGEVSSFDAPAWLVERAPAQAWALWTEAPLHFVDRQRGFALLGNRFVSSQRLLASTVDGGRNWSPVMVDGRPLHPVNAVAFAADGMHGLAVGPKGAVWATSDAGVHWQRRPDVAAGKDDLAQVWLPGGAGLAFTLSPAGRLFRSADGGQSWAPVPSPGGDGTSWGGPVAAPTFAEDGRLIRWTGDDDEVWTSADAGRSWTLQWLPPRRAAPSATPERTEPLSPGIVVLGDPPGRACVARLAGLFCSEPGGWALQRRSDADLGFLGLARADDGRHAWAVGLDGLILATADAGATWLLQRSGTRHRLHGVFFLPDARHGWAWGSGVLLATRDAGENWEHILPRIAD